MALKSSGARAQKRNKTKSLFKFKSRGHTGVIIRCRGRRLFKVSRLYTAIVIPTAIYACETWKRTAMIAHRLDVFHRRCLPYNPRRLMARSCHNEEVMRKVGMERLQDIVATRRRKMADHIIGQQRERTTHTAMYWVPEDGRRKRGRPKKT